MKFLNDEYAYKTKDFIKGEVGFSEGAVEYTLYYLGEKIKVDQCEWHMVDYFVAEEIKKHKSERNE